MQRVERAVGGALTAAGRAGLWVGKGVGHERGAIEGDGERWLGGMLGEVEMEASGGFPAAPPGDGRDQRVDLLGMEREGGQAGVAVWAGGGRLWQGRRASAGCGRKGRHRQFGAGTAGRGR